MGFQIRLIHIKKDVALLSSSRLTSQRFQKARITAGSAVAHIAAVPSTISRISQVKARPPSS